MLDKNRELGKEIKEGKELSKKEEIVGNDDKKELEEANKELKSTTNKDLLLTLIPIEILLFSLITTALLKNFSKYFYFLECVTLGPV